MSGRRFTLPLMKQISHMIDRLVASREREIERTTGQLHLQTAIDRELHHVAVRTQQGKHNLDRMPML
jgi:hypothetical protein